MRTDDIVNRSAKKDRVKAKQEPMKAKLYKTEGNKIIYSVNSAHGSGYYLVSILLLDLTSRKLSSLRDALNGNIKISCTCDAFLYQGYKYIAYKGNVGIDKETRSPDKTNPTKQGLACKHILVALEQMKNDYNAIADAMKSYLAEAPSNKSSYEQDLKILTDFKEAISSLYKAYVDHSKSNPEEEFSYDTDPMQMLSKLSKPTQDIVKRGFIGKLKSLENIINLISQKRNGFNVLFDSDFSSIVRKLNSLITTKSESAINNIIFKLIGS